MIKTTRVDGSLRNFPVAGLVGSKQELDTLVRTVAIAGYNSVIRRLVRKHFESCEVCHLPVARQDGARPPHLHEDCRPQFRRGAKARRRGASLLGVPRRAPRPPRTPDAPRVP